MLSSNPSAPHMCPVQRLQRYMSRRREAGIVSEWMFPKADGTPLSSNTPCSVVQQQVAAVNAEAYLRSGVEDKWGPADSYGSHSLRRGGVTEARKSGVDMLEIQRHGRWTSAAVWGYVGPTEQQQLAVTKELFRSGGGEEMRAALRREAR